MTNTAQKIASHTLEPRQFLVRVGNDEFRTVSIHDYNAVKAKNAELVAALGLLVGIDKACMPGSALWECSMDEARAALAKVQS